MRDFYDVTVIGGGPVGMFATFYAGLRDAKVQLIESLDQLGGQVAALYPYKTILDVGGYAGLTGKQLIAALEKQLHGVNPNVKLGQTVLDVQPVKGGYRVVTNRSKSLTRTVIIAIGGGAFKPRKLMVKNARRFENRQLFYSVNDLDRFRHRSVLVAGGGNSAIDNALLLSKVANQVYLLHRRNQFRGFERMVDRLKASSVKLITPYLIRQLQLTAAGQLLVVAKKMRTTDVFKRLKVDRLVVNFGFIVNDRALKKWRLNLKEIHRRLLVGHRMLTSQQGIYAVGDVAAYPGKDTLIATGLGEVPIAVNSIMRSLYPKRLLPIHSTMLHR